MIKEGKRRSGLKLSWSAAVIGGSEKQQGSIPICGHFDAKDSIHVPESDAGQKNYNTLQLSGKSRITAHEHNGPARLWPCISVQMLSQGDKIA